MAKCLICDKRPQREGSRYCGNCGAKVEADTRRRRPSEPEKFLTFRGNVVGLFPNGDGMLRSRLLSRSPERLPKGKTIDLDHYCPGFDRGQIRKFKAAVLRLTGV